MIGKTILHFTPWDKKSTFWVATVEKRKRQIVEFYQMCYPTG